MVEPEASKHPDPSDPRPEAARDRGIAARAMAALQAPYLAALNPEQRAAVETLDGPVLVLAGAGTGKTRVLTSRVAHILRTGRARPSQILAVTFTNKAAREMKERIGAMLGEAVEGMPWLGTFHAIGVKLLRRHAELVGLRPDFTILDTDDQVRLLKQLIEAADIDEKRWPARHLATLVDSWKNRGLLPAQVAAREAAGFADGQAGALYAAYQERLKVLNAADFGDLLLEGIRLFTSHPGVLRRYQDGFKYLLVDEYQDTNVAQYLWLRLLGQGAKNICCVGDDDQSIYGWRGAEVDNILRFEKDFPGARIIRLERNYRSTGHILAAASHLVSHNTDRLGKTLRTESEQGDKVKVAGAWDSEEEARAIGEAIEALQRDRHRLAEIAILVRASFQMREFEDRFVTLGLPYRVIGGPRFYERAEIRDALAYLRCLASPRDDLAFERIINVPKRGLGDATVQLIHAHARAHRLPLMEAAKIVTETEELKPKARASLRDLLAAFERWRGQREALPHAELAEIVLDESGYTEMWQKDRSADAAGRLENLKELVRSLEEFESLQGFLEHIALVTEGEGNADADAVLIMTLHSAKGLEFDTVFLPGWEEGLFPHQRALDQQGRAGLEEERRLAHVGITRARRRVSIYFATNRRIHGLWQSTVPSRFLDELPTDHVEIIEADSFVASRFETLDPFESDYATPGWQRARNRRSGEETFEEPASRRTASRRRGPMTIDGELVAKSTGVTSAYAIGDRIFHLKFGYGAVVGVDGNKLTVAFDKAGEKRVIDSYVEPT
jgi:DNA helicase II / ATP-dependent DNA helicase PcrA